MIEYQLTGWVKTAFSYTGTVLPRVIYRLWVLPALTCLLLLMKHGHLGLDPQLFESIWLPPLGHSLIGTALGLVLVFRNNASYDRYWEGRKQWGGIVNASRNLARAARSYTGESRSLAPLICAFCVALKHQLRGEDPRDSIATFVSEEDADRFTKHPNPSLAVNLAMSEWIASESKSKRFSQEQAQRMEEQVSKLMDCQGACERILKTPVPFAHAIHVRQLLFAYLLTLPFVIIPQHGWASLITITVISLGLLGIEEAGIEIEDPFGHDHNDLPLSQICDVIARDVLALDDFDQRVQRPTVELSDANEYIEEEEDA